MKNNRIDYVMDIFQFIGWLSFFSVFFQCYLPDFISRVMIVLCFSIQYIRYYIYPAAAGGNIDF